MSHLPARRTRPARRTPLTAALTATLTATLGAGVLTAGLLSPASAGPKGNFPETFALPDGFQPEGITISGRFAWFGSRLDGDVYRADLRTGEGERISEGPGTASVGLKVDDQGRLFIAGGPAGTARVVDGTTGELLADYTLNTGASFVNDVVLTEDAAWFTDSQAPVLHVLPLGEDGALPTQAEVRQVPLTGDWQQVEGFNANGLTLTPDGRGLLVVNSTSGLLYRVDPTTGVATEVDLGGASLTNGDGMLLQGRTLYVVQNRDNVVTVLRMKPDGLTGERIGAITDSDFDVPTTVARKGQRLYLPNARFSTPPTPETTYDVVKVSGKSVR
jgi:sugar lactone lactonase YvrE